MTDREKFARAPSVGEEPGREKDHAVEQTLLRVDRVAREAVATAERFRDLRRGGLGYEERAVFFALEILTNTALEVGVLLAQQTGNRDARRVLLDAQKQLVTLIRTLVNPEPPQNKVRG